MKLSYIVNKINLFFALILIPLTQYEFFGDKTIFFTLTLILLIWFSNIKKQIEYLLNRRDIPYIVLLLLVLYFIIHSTIINPGPNSTNIRWKFLMNTALMYSIFRDNFKTNTSQGFLYMLLILGLINSIISIFQFLHGSKFYFIGNIFPNKDYIFESQSIGNIYSGLGIFKSRAYNAIFQLFILNLLFYYLIIKRKKLIYSLLLIITVIGIISTNSRIGFLLLIFDITFYLLYLINNNYKKLFNQIICIILMCIILIFSTRSPINIFKEGLKHRFKETEIDAQYRKILWEKTIYNLNSLEDLILGLGLGSTGYREYYVEVHNGYLELLAETGIIGLFLWLYFIFQIYYSNNRNIKILDRGNRTLLVFLYLFSFNILINCLIGSETGGSIRNGDIIIIMPFALIQAIKKITKEVK